MSHTLLLPQVILFSRYVIILSTNSCYYQQDSSYYHMPHAIINTIHAIINNIYTIIIYPMLLLTINDAIINQLTLVSAKPILLSDNSYSDTSTTHIIIRHIILLSDTYVIFKQITLLSDNSYYYQHLNLLFLHFISYHYYPNCSPRSSWCIW